MKQYLWSIVISIMEIINTIILFISMIVTIYLWGNMDKHWDNGALPGYDEASSLFEMSYGITMTFALISIGMAILLCIISLIKLIISIIKTRANVAISQLICTFICGGNVLAIIFIMLTTLIFTYATGV